MKPKIVPWQDWPTGRVATLYQMCGGLFEWRFVAEDWTSPLPHLHWLVVSKEDDAELFWSWVGKLRRCGPVTWHLGKDERYEAAVSYDPVDRPVLVKVGGFR